MKAKSFKVEIGKNMFPPSGIKNIGHKKDEAKINLSP
jgi:hypothetical protein